MHYLRRYDHYKIDISKKDFLREDGSVINRTATLIFYEKTKKKDTLVQMGYITEDEIFKMIENHEPINLDQCFIDHLSMKKFRQSRQIEETELIDIASFSAKNCFFESFNELDFSYLIFNNQFSISLSEFSDCNISFQGSIFNCKKTNFHEVYFNEGQVNFHAAIFNSEIIDFKNTIFGKGEKDFQDIEFNTGEVLFTNVDFGSGNV